MATDKKRQLGVYYTPKEVTDSLSRWAIRDAKDRILEPSFGGCNFLSSSVESLKSMGCKRSLRNIYGFDIDPNAFAILRKRKLETHNFVHGDFLDSSPSQSELSVQVILGNPPYVPVHRLEKVYKARLFKKFKAYQYKVPRRASLWVYFILHSLQFLEKGGRMAWVVPDSIAFTQYGQSFLGYISSVFGTINLIRIDERFFNATGTHEKTSLLLCDGFQISNCEPIIVSFETLSEALKCVDEKKNLINIRERTLNTTGNGAKHPRKIASVSLGDIYTIRIGIVLGATKLLTFKKADAFKSDYYPNFLYPIITKGKQLNNLSISPEQLYNIVDSPIFLIDAIKLENENAELFMKFFCTIPETVLLNQTFSKRNGLFAYDDFNYPDAFITYYSQGLPKLILNIDRRLNCTNSIHRLYIKEKYRNVPGLQELISLQLYVDYFEKEIKDLARPYGNMISKFEPSDIAKLPVLLPERFSTKFARDVRVLFEEAVKLISNCEAHLAKQMIVDFLHLVFN